MVRYYMHGHSIQKIAEDLDIPLGTVKSRLSTGRQHIKKGGNMMESYEKKSYEPEQLFLSCSGAVGLNGEPFSLVKPDDKLTQNVLLLAYEKPISISELAKALGVPAGYIEPVVNKMVDGELMQRTASGLVYTDFIIYTENDRMATFNLQLKIADDHLDLFWDETQKGLEMLQKKEFYKKQKENAKKKLEMHFCINTILYACVDIRNKVTGEMPYSEYPYRKDGGRWFGIGNKYAYDYDENNDIIWDYSISGEAGIEIKNFREAKKLQIRKYDNALGKYPNNYFSENYLRWFYELYKQVNEDESAVSSHISETAEDLIEAGILQKDDKLALAIPVLTSAEYFELKTLSSEFLKKVSQNISDELIKLYQTDYVKLPKHLKSVPKWQQYMFCDSFVAIAVIRKAIEKKKQLEKELKS